MQASDSTLSRTIWVDVCHACCVLQSKNDVMNAIDPALRPSKMIVVLSFSFFIHSFSVPRSLPLHLSSLSFSLYISFSFLLFLSLFVLIFFKISFCLYFLSPSMILFVSSHHLVFFFVFTFIFVCYYVCNSFSYVKFPFIFYVHIVRELFVLANNIPSHFCFKFVNKFSGLNYPCKT